MVDDSNARQSHQTRYVLGIDLGTGGVRAALFDERLQIVCKTSAEYPSSYPQPGYVEQNPEDWWSAIGRAVGDLLACYPIGRGRLVAIGVDAMAPVLVVCDRNGRALRPAIIWLDRRATEQCRSIDLVLKEELFRISGNHNDPSNIAPKAMWVRQHEPDLYGATAVLHSASGYLVHRLTGIACLDVTQCGLSQLCDTGRSAWDTALINGCGLDRDKLPPIAESTEVIGGLTPAAARELGLEAGIKIVAGSMDNVAAGLGLGVCDRDQAYVSAGTATNFCACSDSPVYDHAFHLYRHIRAGRFLSVAGVDYGGAGVKWLKQLLGNVDYRQVDELVAATVGTHVPMVFLPYMVGQRAPLWNDETSGVLFGLHPSVGRGDLFRAIMEGNAVALRRVAVLFRRRGFHVASVRLTGGGSLSAENTRGFSDALGLPLDVFDDSDVAVRGAAMTAAYGAGLFASFEEMTRLVSPQRHIEPDPRMTSYFDEIELVFGSIYEKLQPEFRALAGIRSRYMRDSLKPETKG